MAGASSSATIWFPSAPLDPLHRLQRTISPPWDRRRAEVRDRLHRVPSLATPLPISSPNPARVLTRRHFHAATPPPDALHGHHHHDGGRKSKRGSSRLGAAVRMLAPVHVDGIVAEGLLPGEPRPASVSTRGHANKIGTPPRPRHIPYSCARMVKHV